MRIGDVKMNSACGSLDMNWKDLMRGLVLFAVCYENARSILEYY